MPTPGFSALGEERVEEIAAVARRFRHDRTGAEILFLDTDDDNKVFVIGFATPPPDHTGLPHILEHSVLNGSQRYPVKEPFAELLRGSLYTYLNASTYPDRTVYPVASRNTCDFHNLVDVYLDAVFHPLLTRETFLQEGWHYELTDPDGVAEYSGVVYNEMQGVFSDPESRLGTLLDRALFPDSIYGLESGGDPRHIPELTYEAFVDYHRRYYHPANSRTVIYGDADRDACLAQFARAVDGFGPLDIDVRIAPQPRRALAPRHHGRYAVGADEDSGRHTYALAGWLLGPQTTTEELLALKILSRILTDTDAAPLNQALTQADLGEDTLDWGVSSETLDTWFAIGLRDTDPQHVDAMEQVIESTLRRLATDGVPPKLVEAAINSTEFTLREANYGRNPRGLVRGLTVIRSWTYGGDPLAFLRYEAPLARIRRQAAAGGYFEAIIRRHLLDNPHHTTVVLEPDPDFEAALERETRTTLATHLKGLSAAERQALVDQGAALRAAQERPDSPEALATIPKLPVSAVDRDAEEYPFAIVGETPCRLSLAEQHTDGIAYVKLVFDVGGLPADDLFWLPLFAEVALEAGTDVRDYVDMTQEIMIHTGGLKLGYNVAATKGDEPGLVSNVTLTAKCLTAKVPRLFAILAELLGRRDWSAPRRLEEIAAQARAQIRAAVARNGHYFAWHRLAAAHSEVGRCLETTNGFAQLWFLDDLAPRVRRERDAIVARLTALAGRIFCRRRLHVHVTGGAAELAAVRAALPAVLDALPEGDAPGPVMAPALDIDANEGFVVPAQVQYVGKGANLYELGWDYRGDFELLRKYLSRDYLWNRVRVQGNAYGCMCFFDSLAGNLALISYDDPRLRETVDVFDAVAEHLRDLDMDREAFERLLIGAMGTVDAPKTPDQKGAAALRRYLWGVTQTDIQRWREELLDSDVADLRGYAELFARFRDAGSLCVVGPDARLRTAADLFTTLRPVLARNGTADATD